MKLIGIVLILLTVLASPLVASPNSAADAGKVTYSEHIAPILFDNCVSCHRPGQVAPMSLLSYEDTRPWAKAIRRATDGGTMPPWFANPAHGDFREDPRLTEEQVKMIGRWVASGAPQGDAEALPEAPVFSTEWRIGEPDLILTMEPFEVTDGIEDHYEWRSITNPLDEDRWIKEIEVRPSLMSAAHHNLTFVVPAGKGQEALGEQRDLLVGWAPGAMPFRFEDGRGKLLPAGATVLFQMHYHKEPGPGTGGVDATSVGIEFYESGAEVKPVTTMWIVDPILRIPPNEPNYVSESEFVFEDDGVIYNFTPHMHLRGKAFSYTAFYPDGREEVLLDVPNYDFNWQLTYTPREPKAMPKGTKIFCRAVFDNSIDNEANPNPDIEVTWGEATDDEMMIGFMEYAYLNQETMPTFSVPPHLRQQMRQRLEQRLEQEEKEGASER